MRPITFLFVIVLFVSCRNNRESSSKGSDEDKEFDTLTPVLNIDTLTKPNYILHFEEGEPFDAIDIYGDSAYRNKLTDTVLNSHERAIMIQNYLSEKFGNYFYKADSTLVLKLANGRTVRFPDWDNKNEEGYNFEHYFNTIDYYLLHVQRYEGNCWMLVNRKNGYKKYISGLPYISKDNKRIITINADLEASYNFNGIELLTVLKDSLHTELIQETKKGPVNVKWISKNEFLLKQEFFLSDTFDGINAKGIDYKRVAIKKKNKA